MKNKEDVNANTTPHNSRFVMGSSNQRMEMMETIAILLACQNAFITFTFPTIRIKYANRIAIPAKDATPTPNARIDSFFAHIRSIAIPNTSIIVSVTVLATTR